VTYFTAFLIFPDGSHALAMCLAFASYCGPIEMVPIEKRVTVPCDLIEKETAKVYHLLTCYRSEWYEYERKANEITIRAPTGKVTYDILGSW
jgi:hypothetical protein